MQSHTLFISDLHLQEGQPEITQNFKALLATDAQTADAVYILGDLFESWLGDDHHTPFHDQIKSALSTLSTQHVPVYIMRGNRDFLLGHRFAQDTKATWIPDPTVIELYGRRVLLMHGDSLCTLDKAHQFFRLLANSAPIQWLARFTPLWCRLMIAKGLRGLSKKRSRTLTMPIMDVTEEAVIDTLNAHNVDVLIHGHTHQPNIHVTNNNATRIVLGDWRPHATVLRYTDQHQFELVEFPE